MKQLINFLFRNQTRNTQDRADSRIRRIIAQVIARKLNIPIYEALWAMNYPTRHTTLYMKIGEAIERCALNFTRKNDKVVELTLSINWKDGKNTLAVQDWLIADVPDNVLNLLMLHDKPIEVDWEFS